MQHSAYNRALSLFDHRYRSVISVLFDARNEDYRVSRLRENPQVSAEAVDFMRSLDLIEIEDGTVALSRDLVEFLERTLGVSDFVMTGRIGEINVDIQRFYNFYETCSTSRDRTTLALRIKRLSKQLIADLRNTQRDLRRLLDNEFRFETSLQLKLEQLEIYQQKSKSFVEDLEKCQRMFQDQATMRASSNESLLITRKQLGRQIHVAGKAAATLAYDISSYIHRAKEDRDHLSKLSQICELIDRQEFQSRSNLVEILESGALAHLQRAEPIRTTLPSDLNGDAVLQGRLFLRAEHIGMMENREDKHPTMEDDEDNESEIYLPDIPNMVQAFQNHHDGRDLLIFLLEAPNNFPKDELLLERILESFCMIATAKESDSLYVLQELGERQEKYLQLKYLQIHAELIDGASPRSEVDLPIISVT
jgi:hypothetical protein